MWIRDTLNDLKGYSINSLIYYNYYHKKIDENLVYVESREGCDFTGNILRIVEELSTGNYGNFKIHVFAKPSVVDKIKALQKNYDLKINKIITKESLATATMEKAKYIFTDSKIRPKYVKREGQVFVNTWHGTPLEVMGKDNVCEQHLVGNVQYPLLCSDYLVFPNEFMKEKMTSAFMIEKIFPGKILMEGYPRNSCFLDENKKEDLKSKLNLDDYEIFAYMPAFRSVSDEQNDYLIQLDENLKDNQLLLVKQEGNNESQIDFTQFNHIMPFPIGYEEYDVLNMADILITDYSTVFVDFAISKRKIVLFNYDEDEYCKGREFYFSLSDLPFPKVRNIDDLVSELNSSKNYDDEDFINKFCQFDRLDCVKYICRHIFNHENCCREISIENGKENILIYAGSLLNNGIFTSLINFLSRVDLDKYNYFISFKQWDENIAENHVEIFKNLPEGIEYLPFGFNLIPTYREKRHYDKFFYNPDMKFSDPLNNLFERSFNRQYFPLKFKLLIDYDGYNKNQSLLFSHNDFRNAVWVHNDMIQEIKTRGNQNRDILKEVYSKSDYVCVVSKDLIKPTREISGKSDNIRVIHNINNYESIIEDSKKEIQFDESTEFYSRSKDIESVLSKKGKKFISVGRFSPEKGHSRLINAFNEFCKDYPDSQLILIGGHGPLYEDTVDLINGLEYGDNISLIKGISNPMPILKQCDLFILSSFYEGWGIVIMEADTLGVPVISTDIVGTQWLRDYGGNLVENSQEGILDGMYEFMKGNIATLNIDYEEFNEKIISDFYSMVE